MELYLKLDKPEGKRVGIALKAGAVRKGPTFYPDKPVEVEDDFGAEILKQNPHLVTTTPLFKTKAVNDGQCGAIDALGGPETEDRRPEEKTGENPLLDVVREIAAIEDLSTVHIGTIRKYAKKLKLTIPSQSKKPDYVKAIEQKCFEVAEAESGK